MKRVVVVLFFLVVSVAMLGAGTENKRCQQFLGLWEGVDVNDGSKRTISMTDHDGDGVVEVNSRDTFWTLCDGDRGLERATGGVRHDGVLVTEGMVHCFESGIMLPVMQTYDLSNRTETLIATPNVQTLEPITLHRVSRK